MFLIGAYLILNFCIFLINFMLKNYQIFFDFRIVNYMKNPPCEMASYKLKLANVKKFLMECSG